MDFVCLKGHIGYTLMLSYVILALTFWRFLADVLFHFPIVAFAHIPYKFVIRFPHEENSPPCIILPWFIQQIIPHIMCHNKHIIKQILLSQMLINFAFQCLYRLVPLIVKNLPCLFSSCQNLTDKFDLFRYAYIDPEVVLSLFVADDLTEAKRVVSWVSAVED